MKKNDDETVILLDVSNEYWIERKYIVFTEKSEQFYLNTIENKINGLKVVALSDRPLATYRRTERGIETYIIPDNIELYNALSAAGETSFPAAKLFNVGDKNIRALVPTYLRDIETAPIMFDILTKLIEDPGIQHIIIPTTLATTFNYTKLPQYNKIITSMQSINFKGTTDAKPVYETRKFLWFRYRVEVKKPIVSQFNCYSVSGDFLVVR